MILPSRTESPQSTYAMYILLGLLGAAVDEELGSFL